jgi:hypothetical protein
MAATFTFVADRGRPMCPAPDHIVESAESGPFDLRAKTPFEKPF